MLSLFCIFFCFFKSVSYSWRSYFSLFSYSAIWPVFYSFIFFSVNKSFRLMSLSSFFFFQLCFTFRWKCEFGQSEPVVRISAYIIVLNFVFVFLCGVYLPDESTFYRLLFYYQISFCLIFSILRQNSSWQSWIPAQKWMFFSVGKNTEKSFCIG